MSFDLDPPLTNSKFKNPDLGTCVIEVKWSDLPDVDTLTDEEVYYWFNKFNGSLMWCDFTDAEGKSVPLHKWGIDRLRRLLKR